MSGGRTLLVAGVGGVGYEALQDLVGDPRIDQIVAADVAAEAGQRRTNAARYKAAHRGGRPRVDFTSLDMLDEGAIVETLEAVEPDVVLAAATVLRYAPFEELPADERERLIGFGPAGPGYACIIPGQFPLVYNIMQAVATAAIDPPHVINVSLPDIVNPAVARAHSQPLVGSGNICHLVPPIKHLVGDVWDVPMNAVEVYLVMAHPAAHSMLFHNTTGDVPYYMKVLVDGTDVTDSIDLDAELQDRGLPFPAGPTAREVSTLTGTISAQIVRAVLSDTGAIVHAPGPNGLIGGYPVRLDRTGAEVVLPDDITFEHAQSINQEALGYEGIERITDDGGIVFTDTTRDILDDVLGVDVKRFKPSDALAVTEDIIRGYQTLASRHGIEPKLHVTW